MKSPIARTARFATMIAAAALASSCGDSDIPDGSAAPPTLRLVVNGQTAALAVGDSGTASAQVTGGSGTVRFQWIAPSGGGIVALNPNSVANAQVRYAATRSGTARIGLVVVSGGQTVTDTAAVTVSVR